MKFAFIISLLGVGFQSAGQALVLDSSVERMVSTYARSVKRCDVNDLDISSLSSLKNICDGLVKSEFCSDIKPEYLTDCNNLVSSESEIKFHTNLSKALWQECIAGITEFNGFKALIIPVAYMVSAVNEDVEWSMEFLDHSKSSWNYYAAEEDKIEEEDSIWSILGTIISSNSRKRELGYNCLNQQGRVKVGCDFVSGILTYMTTAAGVTAAAIALAPGAISSVAKSAVGAGVVKGVVATGAIKGATAGVIKGATAVGVAKGATVAGVIGVGVAGAGEFIADTAVGAARGGAGAIGGFIAGIRMLPERAMVGVKKENFLQNSSSNLTTNSALSSSDTSSSVAGE